MLGNTANGLFWTYRLLERAENMSRLIETGQRIALTRLNSSDEQWLYVMQTAAVAAEYKKYNAKVEKEAALNWMLRHPENNSSILCSITSARQNAKMVRYALTTDVWEAINGSFLDIQNLTIRTLGLIRVRIKFQEYSCSNISHYKVSITFSKF